MSPETRAASASKEASSKTGSSNMKKFDPATMNWLAWRQRFESYVLWLETPVEKQNLILIESLETVPFEALCAACMPEKVNKYNADTLLYKLQRMYSKLTSKHTERAKFFRLSQQPNEGLVQYANRLRNKLVACAFPATIMEEMLIAAFMGGVAKEETRQHLNTKEPTSFEAQLEDAEKFENGREEAKGGMDSDQSVALKVFGGNRKGQRCFRCGGSHSSDSCWYKDAKCNRCGEKGHIKRKCENSRKVNTVSSEPNDLYLYG